MESTECIKIGSFISIKGITTKVVGIDNNGGNVLLKVDEDDNWHPLSEFKPIKITKEWLDKLGFDKCLFDDDLPEDEMYSGPGGGKFCLKDGCCYRCVETGFYEEIGTAENIHELQYYFKNYA